MTTLPVINERGERIEDVEIPEAILDLTPSTGVIHDVIRQHQGLLRRGTAAVKTRSEVSSSGRKPWRQKGTGRARAGDRGSPIWRGGGVIFGPQPRSFGFSINKKARRKALKSMLAIRFQKGQVVVIDRLSIEAPRTRDLAAIIAAAGTGPSVLIITAQTDRNLALSARNLPGAAAVGIRELNTFTIVSHQKILITREALGHLQSWMEKIT